VHSGRVDYISYCIVKWSSEHQSGFLKTELRIFIEYVIAQRELQKNLLFSVAEWGKSSTYRPTRGLAWEIFAFFHRFATQTRCIKVLGCAPLFQFRKVCSVRQFSQCLLSSNFRNFFLLSHLASISKKIRVIHEKNGWPKVVIKCQHNMCLQQQKNPKKGKKYSAKDWKDCFISL
jgi:hypothetical protein